jgi:hypothetical protein
MPCVVSKFRRTAKRKKFKPATSEFEMGLRSIPLQHSLSSVKNGKKKKKNFHMPTWETGIPTDIFYPPINGVLVQQKCSSYSWKTPVCSWLESRKFMQAYTTLLLSSKVTHFQFPFLRVLLVVLLPFVKYNLSPISVTLLSWITPYITSL